MELPNKSIFEFYEGTNEANYTDLTGINLNKAAKELLENLIAVETSTTDLETKTDDMNDQFTSGSNQLQQDLTDYSDSKFNIAQTQIDAIKSIIASDNYALDTIQELVDFVEANRTKLETIGISNVSGLRDELNNRLGLHSKADDSEKVDGISGERIVYGDNLTKTTNITDVNAKYSSGFYETVNNADMPSSGWYNIISARHTNDSNNNRLQFAGNFNSAKKTYVRQGENGTWNTLWHSGNQGTGSGLDADTVGGISASSIMRNDIPQINNSVATFESDNSYQIDGTNSQTSGLVINQTESTKDSGMIFKISNVFKARFGISSDTNDLYYGGETLGTNKYRVVHEGNFNKVNGLLFNKSLGNTENLNSLNKTGLYFQSNNTNTDVTRGYPEAKAGKLEVTSYDGFVYQTYHIYATTTIWVRSWYNGVWTAWKNIASSSASTASNAGNADNLGNIPASQYVTFSDKATDSQKLDGLDSSDFARVNHTHNYLGATATAVDSDKLGGISSSDFVTKGAAVDDSSQLGGIDASAYVRRDIATNITPSGYIVYKNRSLSQVGVYDSTKTDSIWSMGAAYKNHASGTNFGTLYGLAYKHTNNATGGNMAGGHMMCWVQNGTATAAMGSNIWTSGNVYAFSDKRVKSDIKKIDGALDKLMTLSGYTYERTDVDLPRQTGVIAQEVLEVLPEAVQHQDDGMMSVAYGNMVGLLVEAIKDQQKQINELKELIK